MEAVKEPCWFGPGPATEEVNPPVEPLRLFVPKSELLKPFPVCVLGCPKAEGLGANIEEPPNAFVPGVCVLF